MIDISKGDMIAAYLDFLNGKEFPCVAARAAVARQQVKCMVADSMACPKDDQAILNFLYAFVENYRATGGDFHSVAILFRGPGRVNEEMFDTLMWQRLQALSYMDAQNYRYDKRVNTEPSSPDFSFSIMEEAFFIIGMHPNSSRQARQFQFPILTFNPHAQFEHLRETDTYTKMKTIVRKRDMAFSGSINPMLDDYGKVSEASQYSGRKYDMQWQCPLKVHHHG